MIIIPVTLVALVAIGVTYYSQPQVQAVGREFISSVSQLVNQAKGGEPSIKDRKVQTNLSTIGETAGSPNGPVLRGSGDGKWCPGVKGKIFCGTLALAGISILLDMVFGDAAIGEDEAVAPGWTPMSPSTLTPTVPPTSTPTPTPSSTPSPLPTTTPVTTPPSPPGPSLIPKPSNGFPAIPI